MDSIRRIILCPRCGESGNVTSSARTVPNLRQYQYETSYEADSAQIERLLSYTGHHCRQPPIDCVVLYHGD